MLKIIQLMLVFSGLVLPPILSAAERHIHSSANLGGSELPYMLRKAVGFLKNTVSTLTCS